MGSEGDKLPLFTLPVLKNLKHSGNLCSPLHTNASVPFRWEEQPGKPRLALPPNNTIPKCLELPPRLLFAADARLITKTPSPTTVLEGPYNSVGRSVSFSFLRKGQLPPHHAAVGSTKRDKGSLFGSWRRKTGARKSSAESELHGGNFVFQSVSDGGGTGNFNGEGEAAMAVATVGGKRDVSGLSQAKSHFWATMYGTFKQAIPRRSTKCKKDAP